MQHRTSLVPQEEQGSHRFPEIDEHSLFLVISTMGRFVQLPADSRVDIIMASGFVYCKSYSLDW